MTLDSYFEKSPTLTGIALGASLYCIGAIGDMTVLSGYNIVSSLAGKEILPYTFLAGPIIVSAISSVIGSVTPIIEAVEGGARNGFPVTKMVTAAMGTQAAAIL